MRGILAKIWDMGESVLWLISVASTQAAGHTSTSEVQQVSGGGALHVRSLSGKLVFSQRRPLELSAVLSRRLGLGLRSYIGCGKQVPLICMWEPAVSFPPIVRGKILQVTFFFGNLGISPQVRAAAEGGR